MDNGYRMYFVWTDAGRLCYKICTATSPDLKKWEIHPDPVIEPFAGYHAVANPCAMKVGGKVRMYFTGALQLMRRDLIFVAESRDGIHFSIQEKPIYIPQPGSEYELSCFTPFVFQKEKKWKMIFAGMGKKERFTTFLAEGKDGMSFSPGKVLINFPMDPRFAKGVYKAVLFEDYLYFVGTAENSQSSIYRMEYRE
jgi:predicted GH43/DUF377 family glycosyl hydrolase